MPNIRSETTRFQDLKVPVILTDESVAGLEQQMLQHDWTFRRASVSRTDGRNTGALSIAELGTIDETWWMDCVEFSLAFDHKAGNGRASIDFKRPQQYFLYPEIRTYVSSSDYGASLAAEEEFRRFSLANSAGYGLLARRGFWYSIGFAFQAGELCVILLLKHFHRPIPDPWFWLSNLILFCLFGMGWKGSQFVFPMIQFRLGSGYRRNADRDRRRGRIVSVFWDVVKITVGALMGAWLKSKF
jgi:hypothetical protein